MKSRFGIPLTAIVTASLVSGCGFSGQPQPQPSPSGSSSQDGQALARFYDQDISWSKCNRADSCATVEVPLRYDNPDGDVIKLSLLKVEARGGAPKLGTLLVNPGGPGGSGYDYAQYARAAFSETILKSYDIVGFDPRGVGRSSPITCMDNQQTDDFVSQSGEPGSVAQTPEVVQVAALVGNGCETNSPSLTPNIGTVDVARDMDVIRGALDEPKLNFFAKSYGTFLGLIYADLFPANVGRFVLDGVMDPALSLADTARGQAEGFERALNRFIDDCAHRSNCPLPKKPAAATAKIERWLEQLVEQPLPGATPDWPLTKSLAVNGLIASLYDQNDWPALRSNLKAAFAGDAIPMLGEVDGFIGRNPDGTYRDNSVEALYAVTCLDRPDRANVAETERLAKEWSATAPIFGPELAWGNLPCWDYPAPATFQPHPIAATGAAPILLVGTTYDPATPYPWALSVSKQLVNNSLITWEGDGHTAYYRESDCVDNAVNNYLLTGATPGPELKC